MDGSGIKRGSAVFGDIRGWIDALRDGDELEEITGEVDWDVELGNLIRMMQGSGDGPRSCFPISRITTARTPCVLGYLPAGMPVIPALP